MDLVGGYYDAGDNIKFGFPMAFTITILSWGALENADSLAALGELNNVRGAIRWGTDYLLKATVDVPLRMWVQVQPLSTRETLYLMISTCLFINILAGCLSLYVNNSRFFIKHTVSFTDISFLMH